MATIKVKLLVPHIDKDGRYLRADTVVDWDTTLLNPGQIPAPGLGSVTTAAVAQFDATFPNKILGTAGRPDRYTK